MQRKIPGLLAILLCGCALLAGCTGLPPTANTTHETGATYIVGVDGSYPPFSSHHQDGRFSGFDVESARWIADRMGFEVVFQAVEWNEIIPALQDGRIDMVYSGMTITEERRQQVAFSRPYLKINQTVAVRADATLTMDDVMDGRARIAVQRGTTGEAEVRERLVDAGRMPAENLTPYENFLLAVTALRNREVDAAVYDRPSMIRAIAGPDLKILGEIVTEEEYGIAVRQEDTQLLGTMNAGLELLMSDPYWDELKATYDLA